MLNDHFAKKVGTDTCKITIKQLGYAEVQTWIRAVPTKRKWGKRARFCAMGYLVTGKSASFQTPLLLGSMEKTAPVSLEHQFCQRKKSSTGGEIVLYSTHAACFFTFGYVIFMSNLLRNVWEESYCERYVGNSTKRLSPWIHATVSCKTFRVAAHVSNFNLICMSELSKCFSSSVLSLKDIRGKRQSQGFKLRVVFST